MGHGPLNLYNTNCEIGPMLGTNPSLHSIDAWSEALKIFETSIKAERHNEQGSHFNLGGKFS